MTKQTCEVLIPLHDTLSSRFRMRDLIKDSCEWQMKVLGSNHNDSSCVYASAQAYPSRQANISNSNRVIS